METQTIDINDAQARLKELVAQVAEGAHVILSQGDKPIAQLIPVEQRVAGLHAGTILTSEDFDAPLSDPFLLSEK